MALDLMFLSSEGEHEGDGAAKVPALTIYDNESGYFGVTQLQSKADDHAVRFIVQYLSLLGHQKVELMSDGEPATTAMARKVATKRGGAEKTKVSVSANYSHASMGDVERAHQTVQAQTRCLRVDLEARLKQRVAPGHSLFPWLLRHSGWSLSRYLPRGRFGQSSFQIKYGKPYTGEVLPFGEVVMCRVPHEGHMRHKLDAVWVKGAWAGRTEVSDEHIVLTDKGVVTTRSVRRLPAFDRVDLDVLSSVIGMPWSPKTGAQTLMSHAKAPRPVMMKMVTMPSETKSTPVVPATGATQFDMATPEGAANSSLPASRIQAVRVPKPPRYRNLQGQTWIRRWTQR